MAQLNLRIDDSAVLVPVTLIERLRLYFATAEKAIYYTEQDGQREVTALR
ncbi:MAG TPA: hypothetical protein VNY82_12995 [Steroidobacteraceae bacterium]|nr:hypothetical protein [Steroidobacteraceae bacterium]